MNWSEFLIFIGWPLLTFAFGVALGFGEGTKRKNPFRIILHRLKSMEDSQMKNQAELQAALDAITTKINGIGDGLTDFAADFKAAVEALKAQIEAGVDLEPQVTALTALGTKLDTFAASLKDLDTTAEGISGVETPAK